MADHAATKQKTKTATCETHGSVEATKDVPAFTPPGLFYVTRSLVSPFRPYRCPECGARVA
jgi:hypothetical protein